MLRPAKFIPRTLSVRISLMIVFSMAILLMASLAVMLYYSRKAVKEEATQKAAQTLEGVTQHIDNTLLSVELATGNIFFSMLPHLNNPEMMYTYSRQLVESNHFIAGCAIALKPDFYKDRKYFMAYVHRGDSAGMAYADSKLVTRRIQARTHHHLLSAHQAQRRRARWGAGSRCLAQPTLENRGRSQALSQLLLYTARQGWLLYHSPHYQHADERECADAF